MLNLLTPLPRGLNLGIFISLCLLTQTEAEEARSPDPRPCKILIEYISEPRGPLHPQDRSRLMSLISRVGDDQPPAHSDPLPLTLPQLKTLVELEIALESGSLSLKKLNDKEMQLSRDFKNSELQAETTEKSLKRFRDLLNYLQVNDGYDRGAPRMKRQIQAATETESDRLKTLYARMDRIILKMARKLKRSSDDLLALSRKLSDPKAEFTAEEVFFLNEVGAASRSASFNEPLIASRIESFLSQDIGNPFILARAVSSSIPNESSNPTEIALRRAQIEIQISPFYKIFEAEREKLSPQQIHALDNFKSRFALHLKQKGELIYPRQETRVAFDILEAALRETSNSKRAYHDFTRWILDTRFAPEEAVRFIYAVEAKRNTWLHRLGGWMKFSWFGWFTTATISLVTIGSSASHLAHEFVDPKLPSYQTQLELAKQASEKAIQWSKTEGPQKLDQVLKTIQKELKN